MGEQKVHKQGWYDIKIAVNIQSSISTSYLLCVVYTVLAFLTDNKNVKCASMCESVHAYVCEIRVCMSAAVIANDLSNIKICSKMLHGL